MYNNLLGIIGKPVLHSLSPKMWNAAFAELKINAKYLYVPVDSAKEGIDVMKRVGLKGINITSPFKEAAIHWVDEISETAKQIGAVNTILNDENKLYAVNTDYNGIQGVLKSVALKSKNALVLGTGGAAKAVACVLKDLQFSFTIIGRNQEQKASFQQKFNCEVVGYHLIDDFLDSIDLIISTLPNSTDYLNKNTLNSNHVILDANYKSDTLAKLSQQIGFTYISGLEWLVYQAKPAFELLTGTRIEDSKLRSYLNDKSGLNFKTIAFVGLSGTGKTTVGKSLAQKIGFAFIDIDQEIERLIGKTVPQIFVEQGEEAFRNLEQELLKQHCKKRNVVIACGGGTVLRAENRKVLQKHTLCIWLDASIAYCMQGLDLFNRPLYANGKPLEIAAKVYQERKMLFADAAHVLINVDGKNNEQIVDKLKNLSMI